METNYIGTNQARLLQGNLDFKVATYGRFVMEKETSVAATDGVGTKDSNRYVVVYIINYIHSSWRFWWQNEPKMKVFR